MDGMMNKDAIFQSMVEPHLVKQEKSSFWPPESLSRVLVTVVEPFHMSLLTQHYTKLDKEIPDFHYKNIHFIDKVLNVAIGINAEQNCVFYTVKETCPISLPMKRSSQLSGLLDSEPMKKLFKNNSDLCIHSSSMHYPQRCFAGHWCGSCFPARVSRGSTATTAMVSPPSLFPWFSQPY